MAESISATVILNKRDLKIFGTTPLRSVINTQRPSRSEHFISSTTQIKLFIEKNNKLEPLELQPFTLPVCSDSTWETIVTKAYNSHYDIQNTKGLYELEAEIQCGMENHLIFKSDSAEGELISIWNILFSTKKFFTGIQRLSFWQTKITVSWPSNGDYFSRGVFTDEVNITNGHHWDVVAHELGHAIYHQGRVGNSVGGAHKIDECYNIT